MPTPPPKTGLLQGWKEIAAYVSRDVRTVKRWEKQRALPVRRFPGEGRASVYALIGELDDWIDRAPEAPAPSPTGDVPVMPVGVDAAPAVERALPAAGAAGTPQALPPDTGVVRGAGQARSGRRLRPSAIAAASVGLALVLGLLWQIGWRDRNHRESPRPAVAARALASPVRGDVPYLSKVSGVDELYTRGIFFFEQRTPGTLGLALQCFQDAVARDPLYAPAWAGLANTYDLLREYATMPAETAFERAEASARRAVALDPRLAQAHASLGFIDFFWKWDAAAAEQEFRTAIALDPGAHLPHHWYGSMLVHQGRYAQALVQLDEARRLKPDSLAILSLRAFAIGMDGQRSSAVDLLQEVLNQDRTFPSAHRILSALSLITPRDIPRFLEQREQMSVLSHDEVETRVCTVAAKVYRRAGEQAMWRAVLAAEERAHPGAAGRNYQMAEAEAALGLRDAAFADIAVLVQRRDPYVAGLVINPVMAGLRDDPRFRQLLPRGLLAPAP